MNKIKRSMAAVIMTAALLSQALASTSEPWHVNFQTGAPASVNHQYHYINNLGYNEDGYYSVTINISGGNDRLVRVTQESMSTLIITTTGQSAIRTVNVYVPYPEFRFKGESESSVYANGNWYKN
ncbi:MAG: hypothetical protein J6M24_03910 [Lachnospiraceae bacterium]|nr:hypothetical protein [Lachnospiraceae bacterium]